MKPAMLTMTWGWFLLCLSQVVAAEAVDTASGVYQVRYPGTSFAFRVDPWSQDVRQIRGIGRATIEEETTSFDAYFEILGTYRPAPKHEARGVLCYRNAEAVQSLPWRGTYDPQSKSFTWSATIGERTLPLPRMAAWVAKAEETAPRPKKENDAFLLPRASPFRTVAFLQSSGTSKFLDNDGDIDFTKVLTHVVEKLPDLPPAPSTNPEDIPEWKNDLAIIWGLTDHGAGIEKGVFEATPQEFLEAGISGKLKDLFKNGPIRKRAVYPPIDEPRELQTLKKPAPRPRTMPKLVGMKFEEAAALLWSLGLNPGADCLGTAKDPKQADVVVGQSPAEGSPYPTDGNVRLQWYSRPLGPAESTETTSTGFQPGDGAAVDARLAGAKVFAGGKVIGGGGTQGDASYNWALYKLDEPSVQQAVAGIRPAFAQSAAGATTTETTEVTVAQKKQSETEGVLEFSAHDRFMREANFDKTTYLHYRIYRGFLMHYGHTEKGLNRPLGAVGAAVMESSQKLIDRRFPQ